MRLDKNVLEQVKQTKGTATFRGIIGGLSSDNALTNADKFTKLKFRIKSSDDNMHFVELIDFVNKNYSMYKVNSPDDKDKYAILKLPYDKHERSFEDIVSEIEMDMELNQILEDKGLDLSKLTKDSFRQLGTIAVKANSEGATEYMSNELAITKILAEFEDGDSVVLVCEKTTSGSEDRAFVSYNIKKIFKTKDDINFSAEGYTEQTELIDDFVFDSISKSPAEKRAYVKGMAISYTGATVPIQYVVDWNEYSEDEAVANWITSNCSYGDLVRVEGNIHNRVVYGEKSEGIGRTNRRSVERFIESEKRELQIIGIVGVLGKYSHAQLS